MQWLQTMGKMEVDWPALTLAFVRGEKRIVLTGDSSLTKLEVSLEGLSRTWEDKDQGLLVELRA